LHSMLTHFFRLLIVGAALLATRVVFAGTPEPLDRPYPGTVALSVEATDLVHRIYTVHERIPVKAGELTLLFPKWLPGHHSPGGPIESLTGLRVSASGHEIEWLRDPLDVYAFHLRVPSGVEELEVAFAFAAPFGSGEPTIRPEMFELHWNEVVLYPAGYYDRGIQVAADLTLPAGWDCATALERISSAAGAEKVSFRPTSLETLIDSPVLAGRYARRIDLDPGAKRPVYLDVVADDPQELAASADQIAQHRRLVQEAYQLFGSQHFPHYDFLLAISAEFLTTGVEHHRSSENSVHSGYFKEWDKLVQYHDLLAHEFTHSWNGKFRRPRDLWTPNTNVPMQDSLLWLYEGMTQYWGQVLSVRAGMRTRDDALQAWAHSAASLDEGRPGRTWRNLQDTTNQTIINEHGSLSWYSWQRSADYYPEGALIWLDADTKIRQLTLGQRSLDDFARSFFGMDDGRESPLTYDYTDIVKALNAVAPFDWSDFLRKRLDSHAPRAPLDGLTRAGWRIVYRDKPTQFLEHVEANGHSTDLSHSLDFTVGKDSRIAEVIWGGPAFKAGAAPGQTLEAVNGLAYTGDRLKDAVRAAQSGKPIELLVRTFDTFSTLSIHYTGGLRYPDLERIDGTPDGFADIFKPRAAPPAAVPTQG
jgi:predicted metalloprotease with PDZ domain